MKITLLKPAELFDTFLSKYHSVKLEAIKLTNVTAASSSSTPSATILIVVPFVIPKDKTPKRLFAFTLRSSFSTHILDLNSFALFGFAVTQKS